MTNDLDDLLSHLDSVIQQLKRLKEKEHVENTNEDLAWELLSQIEELFMTVFT